MAVWGSVDLRGRLPACLMTVLVCALLTCARCILWLLRVSCSGPGGIGPTATGPSSFKAASLPTQAVPASASG